MAIVYVGIDLAKNVFAVHGVDEHGQPALVRPSVPRQAARVDREFATVRDRHGSLFGCPPLLAKTKTDAISRWAAALEQRRGYWKAVVAIAAKNARLAWAVLHQGERFALPT